MCEYPVATNRYDTSVLKRSHTSGAECGGGFSLSGIRALVYHFNMSCPVIQVGTTCFEVQVALKDHDDWRRSLNQPLDLHWPYVDVRPALFHSLQKARNSSSVQTDNA
jgi:hypothetical protein